MAKKPKSKKSSKSKKKKLSKRERQIIRIRAARKAAETRKKRMETDPEFAERMRENYRKSGERLKNYWKERRKNEKPKEDFDTDVPDIISDDFDTPDYDDEDTMDDYDDEVSEEDLSLAQQIFEEFKNRLSANALNENTAKYLIDLINQFYPDGYADKDLIDKIINMKDEMIDKIDPILYDSGYHDGGANIINSALSLANYFTNGDYSEDDILDAVHTDMYIIRKNGRKKYRHR